MSWCTTQPLAIETQAFQKLLVNPPKAVQPHTELVEVCGWTAFGGPADGVFRALRQAQGAENAVCREVFQQLLRLDFGQTNKPVHHTGYMRTSIGVHNARTIRRQPNWPPRDN